MADYNLSCEHISIENSPINIAIFRYIDGDFIFVCFNEMAEKTEGLTKEEVLGRPVTEAFPGVKKLGLFDALLRIHEKGGYEELELAFYEDARISGWRKNRVSRLQNGDIIVFYEDLTQQKILENELLKQKKMLEEAQGIAHLGSWEWNIKSNEIVWSDEVFHIFGEAPQSFRPTFDAFLSYFYEEDRAALMEAVDAALKRQKPYLFEHRVRCKDGSERYVQESGSIRFDDQNNALSMIGTVLDITEQKKAETLLESLGRIVDNSINEIYIFDAQSFHFTYANHEAQRKIGYTLEEMLNMTPVEIKPEHTRDSYFLLLKPLLEGSKESLVTQTIHRRKDGKEYNAEVRLQLMEIAGEKQIVVIAYDISARVRMEERLKRLAMIDSLTGIYNRHQTNEELDIEIARAERYNDTFALAMLDIDHFKRINDSYGHDVGDYVLKEFSSLISEHLRESDRFGRWGGEEFVIILPELDAKEAMQVAEKLRKLVEEHRFKGVPQVTVSIGVTVFRVSDVKETLLKEVDKALYQAKEEGRNRAQFI